MSENCDNKNSDNPLTPRRTDGGKNNAKKEIFKRGRMFIHGRTQYVSRLASSEK